MSGPVATYALTLAAVVTAGIARWLLDPWLGPRLPFFTFYFAVLFAAWIGGLKLGLLSLALSTGAGVFLFAEPRLSLHVPDLVAGLDVMRFIAVGLCVSAICEALHRQRRRIEVQSELARVTLASIGDAVVSTDTAGRVTEMNAVAEALTGWRKSDAIGQPLDVVFHIVNEHTREQVENPAAKVLSSGIVVGLANHTMLIAKDGTERPIDDSAAPIRSRQGQLVGCVLVFRDVTERRRREKALLEREQQFGTLAESIPQLCWMAHADGHIFWYNRRWYDYTGTTFEQMQGWGWQSVHDPDELPRVLARWQASLASGEPFDMVFPLRGKDGVFRPFLTRVVPLRDNEGRVTRWVGTNTDITEARETAERERRLLAEASTANAKFRAFFDQGALFAGIMDLDGTVIEPNRLSWEGCGFTREQIVGKPFWEGPWWAPSAELVERIRAASAQAAAGQMFRDEMPYYVGDGSQRIADVTIQPIKDETGRVLFLAPTGTDITERRRLENDLRKLAADLSEADRRKDQFLATLAHELRNPLAPLRNMLEVMKRVEGDGDMLRRARDTMERQLEQLVRLVDDLIDVSRISRDKLELRLERVELASVIHQAVEACRPMTDDANQNMRWHLPPEPIYLHADRVRLAQVFSNLLNNSCKYTQPGGDISITAERQGSDVVVTIKDTGAGIPTDKLDSIFDMFMQVDRTLERSQGGLGIGLTLVKRLVLMHGGSVEARSEGEGRGSELVVRLPILSDEPQAAVTSEPTRKLEPATPRRILVVDDNVDSAVSLATLLQMTGNDSFTAHDGREALEAAEQRRPDTVLLDIGLPELNGYEVCRRIRAQPWGKSMLLIALTGWGQDEDRRKSQDAGFDGHLVKPVDYSALMSLLKTSPLRGSGR